MHPYIRHYFQQHPQLKQCFQTFDGIIHPSKEVAGDWVAKYTHKTIEVFDNPVFEGQKEEETPVEDEIEIPAEEETK